MGSHFCILTVKFTLALFFGSYPWLFFPVEWSLSPNVGSKRTWDLTVTVAPFGFRWQHLQNAFLAVELEDLCSFHRVKGSHPSE